MWNISVEPIPSRHSRPVVRDPLLVGRGRQGLGRRDAEPEAPEVEPPRHVRHPQHQPVRRRAQNATVTRWRSNASSIRSGSNGPGQDGRGAEPEGEHEEPAGAEGEGERRMAAEPVLLDRAEDVAGIGVGRSEDVRVLVGAPLRHAGGARRVGDHRDVVGPGVRGLEALRLAVQQGRPRGVPGSRLAGDDRAARAPARPAARAPAPRAGRPRPRPRGSPRPGRCRRAPAPGGGASSTP